ncbi:MAG: GIY-YIG nuclease family protein, partial [Candidatus Omnitrophica bacterium]|nr:GIY-YIG nuclease family protein [Candidatus Omnitrophota bacterium]
MEQKNLKEKAARLPESPGAYLFKDQQGKVLYIGKAKSLKKRVQSYFTRPLDSKTQAMVSKIMDLEFRLTPSETQAQILEAALIKKIQPPYNIDLKDDKSFPWIRITDEKFPVVSVYRRKKIQKNDRSIYFGPYTNVKLLRQAIKIIRKVFGFRSCKALPAHACLYYRLKLCPAPCEGKISVPQYRKLINQIKLFLDSRFEELQQTLSEAMQKASDQECFEEAAKMRDQINALRAIAEENPLRASADALEDLKKLLRLAKSPRRI